ncbi:MAG: TRCF domain-containing protein, partial [Mycobacteriaceae bacterium]
PPDYVASDRLRLEAYRKLAEAQDEAALTALLDELIDRYGAPPEPVHNLFAVARLRLLCRHYEVSEVTVAGTQLKLSPLPLPDSKQLRLKRLYPSAQYKPTSHVVQLPLPRVGTGGVGAERLRDTELLQFVADLLLQLDGKPKGMVAVSQPTAVSAE